MVNLSNCGGLGISLPSKENVNSESMAIPIALCGLSVFQVRDHREGMVRSGGEFVRLLGRLTSVDSGERRPPWQRNRHKNRSSTVLLNRNLKWQLEVKGWVWHSNRGRAGQRLSMTQEEGGSVCVGKLFTCLSAAQVYSSPLLSCLFGQVKFPSCHSLQFHFTPPRTLLARHDATPDIVFLHCFRLECKCKFATLKRCELHCLYKMIICLLLNFKMINVN